MFLLSFFKGITLKQIMAALSVAATAFALYVGATFVDSKYKADAEVARLELSVAGYKEDLRILEEAGEQKDRAIDAADAARIQLEIKNYTYEEIRRNAASSPEEDNGEISPVLRRTLDALDSLR